MDNLKKLISLMQNLNLKDKTREEFDNRQLIHKFETQNYLDESDIASFNKCYQTNTENVNDILSILKKIDTSKFNKSEVLFYKETIDHMNKHQRRLERIQTKNKSIQN